QACPTDSIQFGELDDLRERAEARLLQLQEAGQSEARLYLEDDEDGVGGAGAFFLLLDEPEVYGLPPDPVDPRRRLGTVWAAWAASFAGLAVSPPLLISDLGVPRRFLNMLRMFKVTSPMSVGSWLLTAAAPVTGVAAANAWAGLFPRLSRVARPAAALLGLPV